MYINRFFSLEKTIAAKVLEGCTYPHEVLPRLKEFIYLLGNDLSTERFENIGDGIWIAKSAKVSKTAHISAPCIIDEDAEIRHCAFIRGCVIVGKGAVVGNSTELKNCLLFDNVQVPHYNYIGDSVLGYKAHFGAASLTSNVRSDKGNVRISYGKQILDVGMKKLGAMVGDCVEIGCGAVLNPGTVIGKHTIIHPLASVKGFVKENSIYKQNGVIVEKENR